MQLILAVYDALRSFDRPCTRAEIEREALLTRDEVRIGLDGLRRRHAIRMEGLPRQQATYRLVPGAERPEDLRGQYERSEEQRRRMRHRASAPGVTGPRFAMDGPASYSPAAGPSRNAMPGAARQVKGGISFGNASSITPCALALSWRKR